MAWQGHWAGTREQEVSVLVPPGQAVLPGEGMEPAGAGGKGQLLHKALLEQKSQPAARGQTGLPACSAVRQPSPQSSELREASGVWGHPVPPPLGSE